MLTLISLFSIAILSVVRINAENTDIMGCVICEMLTESLSSEMNPTSVLTSMYRRCSRVGLMEPVCMSILDENAKQILKMSNNGMAAKQICVELNFCNR
uniref:Saposin B-type domain-containing protein n=1 Tax=Acrobeloides nanus TaxID=290746 RepID=A0A914DY96_9BILA